MSARQTAALAALQSALAAAFAADPAVAAPVGGRIHDGAPRAPVLPYLAFGSARCRDFSSGDSVGTRALLTLEAVAGDGERGLALAVLDAAVARATEGPLALAAGTPVLVRLADSAVERTRDGRGWRATAVIEALIDG